jgi:4-hydroxy-tetrahydrodipicolinate synthase
MVVRYLRISSNCMSSLEANRKVSLFFGQRYFGEMRVLEYTDNKDKAEVIKEDKIMAVFKGAGVAIVTPMKDDFSVHYEKLGELLDEQIEGKTDAIIICGTTGESATLSEAEHLKTIQYTIDRVAKRVPVVAGTGSNSTRTAIELSKGAASYGADAVLVVTPYYNKATQKGLIAHYTAIAQSIPDTPVIMYNVPSRTGCNLLPQTIAYLFEHVPNIVGVKEASGDISQVAKIMELTGGEIELYSGNDDQIVPLLSLGGIGVISVLSNIAPKETHDIVMKYLDGDTKGSLELQLQMIPLIEALFCEVSPIPVKTAMNLMGKECGPLRAPMCEMEPENQKRLMNAMENAGLLGVLEPTAIK